MHFSKPLAFSQRANNEKREFFQLQLWMRHMGFSALGIQTGPLSALEANFSSQIFQLFTFILGSPFLLPQRANNEKREFFQLQIWMRHMGFSALGIQAGPFTPLPVVGT